MHVLREWCAAWLAMGVEGVKRSRFRGRYRFRYTVTVDLIRRWEACELPSPHDAAPRAAHQPDALPPGSPSAGE